MQHERSAYFELRLGKIQGHITVDGLSFSYVSEEDLHITSIPEGSYSSYRERSSSDTSVLMTPIIIKLTQRLLVIHKCGTKSSKCSWIWIQVESFQNAIAILAV